MKIHQRLAARGHAWASRPLNVDVRGEVFSKPVGHPTKKIEATIKPFKLDEVKEALLAMGIEGLSACEIKGFGRQEEHAEIYRGSEYTTDCSSKVKLEIIVPDELASSAVAAIQRAARTGAGDDGKILVLPIEDVLHPNRRTWH